MPKGTNDSGVGPTSPTHTYKDRPCFVRGGFRHHHAVYCLHQATSYLIQYTDNDLPAAEFVSAAYFRRKAWPIFHPRLVPSGPPR